MANVVNGVVSVVNPVKVTLGLGSNEGDRRGHLEVAVAKIRKLSRAGRVRISPVYETPALLPEGASAEWNRPFLNLVVEAQLDGTPKETLAILKGIEAELGRGAHSRWAPRPIDIDILLWGEEPLHFHSPELTLPHPQLLQRAFVLDPLKDLNPKFLHSARNHPQHSPLWMGILNITPDSFSDGGQYESLASVSRRLDEWDAFGVPLLDIGAESTRPGATPLTPQEEWTRLEPVLVLIRDRYGKSSLKPWISVDTRFAETAARAIELGVDLINDVSGLADPEMLKVLQSSEVQYVLMHSLSVPASPSQTLREDTDPVPALLKWFHEKLEVLAGAGVSTGRILLDPGIGFGKTALQSLEILRHLDRLLALPYRVLVGHSRKSFFKPLDAIPNQLNRSQLARGRTLEPLDRDLETIGASLQLAGQGVDVIRVHDPVAHIRAARAWNHLNKSEPGGAYGI